MYTVASFAFVAFCIDLRNRIRMYPAFVNCTTIDWFSEWPYDALLEVADKYLETIEMANVEEVMLPTSLYGEALNDKEVNVSESDANEFQGFSLFSLYVYDVNWMLIPPV